MNRAAEFAALAARTTDPGYRKLWTSQAAYYAGQAEAKVKVGNPEPPPEPTPPATPAPKPSPVETPSARTQAKWRAANEPAWAALFDAVGAAWKYEALEPHLSRALLYMPDFWLCDRLAWVEVKTAAPTPGEIRAARELLAADGHRVYMVSGWPRRKRYGLWVFAEAGEAMAVRSDYCDLALCNLFDCSFERLYEAFEEVKR